jgi:hypothetical protein
MNAKTPCYSRHDVRYRRVNLKTRAISLTKKTCIDVTLSTHHTFTQRTRFYVDEICFIYGVDTPERAYESV